MEWYHTALMHPGTGSMEASIRRCFTWPNFRSDIRNYVKKLQPLPKIQGNKQEEVWKIPLKAESKGNAFDTLTVNL